MAWELRGKKEGGREGGREGGKEMRMSTQENEGRRK